MSHCAVYGCPNYYRKTKQTDIKYFSFPKDKELREKWEHCCRRQDRLPKSPRVCSAHFNEDSFEIPLRQRLLNYTPSKSRNLKPDAIPMENLPNSRKYERKPADIKRAIRHERRNRSKEVNELLKAASVGETDHKSNTAACGDEDEMVSKIRSTWHRKISPELKSEAEGAYPDAGLRSDSVTSSSVLMPEFALVGGAGEVKTKIEIKQEVKCDSDVYIKQEMKCDSDVCIKTESLEYIVDSNNDIEIKNEPCWTERISTETRCSSEEAETEVDTSAIDGRKQEFQLMVSTRLCIERGPSIEHAVDASNIAHASRNNNFIQISDDGKGPYKCKICKKRFTWMSSLKEHNKLHEGRKLQYKCTICEKSFMWISSLKRHSMLHEGKRPFKCKFCGKSFIWISYLKRHNMSHEGKRPHKCTICEKRYFAASHLKAHYLSHESRRSHRCNFCGMSFFMSSHLKSHLLAHEHKRPQLKSHNLAQEDKRAYKCKICEKSFIWLTSLKKHSLSHEGKRPHKCNICEKSFIYASDLKRHHLSHEGKRPYNCNVCGKGFTRVWHLERHSLIHESGMP